MRRTNFTRIMSNAAISTIIKNIHDPHYTETFHSADVLMLQTSLAQSELTHHELMNISDFSNANFMHELKRNYYACCMRFHPDTLAADQQKTEIFKLLSNAYQTLLNAYKMQMPEIDDDTDEDLFQKNHAGFFRQNSVKLQLRSVDFIYKPEKQDSVQGIAMSLCGNFVAASMTNEKKITIIDRHTSKCLFVYPRDKENWPCVTKMAFSLDGKKIAFFSIVNNKLCILDIATGEYQLSKDAHKEDHVWNIKTLSNGNYISTAGIFSSEIDNTLKIWDAKTGVCIRTLKGHQGEVRDVVEMSDADHVISASWDETLKIWNIQTGECEHTFTEFKHSIDTVVLTPNKKYIIAGSYDGYFSIWDFETKKQIHEFEGYDCMADPCCGLKSASEEILVSPDSRYFISAANSKILKIWEIETGKQVGEKKLTSHPKSFCSQGDRMFLGCNDGSIKQITFANLELDFLPSLKGSCKS